MVVAWGQSGGEWGEGAPLCHDVPPPTFVLQVDWGTRSALGLGEFRGPSAFYANGFVGKTFSPHPSTLPRPLRRNFFSMTS